LGATGGGAAGGASKIPASSDTRGGVLDVSSLSCTWISVLQ
jgi:hypothetical protein